MIKRKKKVRGFHFSDESGSGYVYPMTTMRINMNDEEEEEEEEERKGYDINGECNCCFECINDENCKNEGNGKGNENEEMKCVGNICVECEDESDCRSRYGDGICNNGKCMNGYYCSNNNDCKDNEICNYQGECVVGCKNDDDCKIDSGELCIYDRCKSGGCWNNFNCNNENEVCIDNECVLVDNSESCLDDNDCSMNYYCEYEYMICVKKTKNTFKKRRNTEVLSAICSFYGIISLFIVANTYSIVSNLAIDKLNEECLKKCGEVYYAISNTAVNRVKKTERSGRTWKSKRNHDSVCTGNCRRNLKVELLEAKLFGEKICKMKILTKIIKWGYKQEFFKHYGTRSVGLRMFKPILSSFCKSFKYSFYYREYKRRLRPTICSVDERSIVCKQLPQDHGIVLDHEGFVIE